MSLIKKILKYTWNLMAIFGCFCLLFIVVSSAYLLKTYDLSPRALAVKIIGKLGIQSEIATQFDSPARPAGIILPDPEDYRWDGQGARKDRQLKPVLYTSSGRPIPRAWFGSIYTGGYIIQNFRQKVRVNNSQELVTAIKQAKPGDIITLNPGIYTTKFWSCNVSNPGTSKMPICVRAEKLGQAVIEMDTNEGFVIRAPYWIFENLDIKGTKPNHSEGEHAFHIIGKGSSFVLRNCRIHEFNAIIKANGSSTKTGQRFFPDNILIENNTFFNSTIRNTSRSVNCLDVVGGNNWIIRGNFMADLSKGQGNRISHAAFVKGNASGTIFENNVVIPEYRHTGGTRVGLSFGGGGTGRSYFRDGKTDVEHTDGVIRNNIIMYSSDVGIYLNKALNTNIYNNLLYKTKGIDVRFSSSTAVIVNNILTGRIRNRDGGTNQAKNNVFLNGKNNKRIYKNADRADFSLYNTDSRQLFVGKALPVPGLFEDFCGKLRSRISDIGPFEYENQKICRSIGWNQ